MCRYIMPRSLIIAGTILRDGYTRVVIYLFLWENPAEFF
jgi:hypothetical protein